MSITFTRRTLVTATLATATTALLGACAHEAASHAGHTSAASGSTSTSSAAAASIIKPDPNQRVLPNDALVAAIEKKRPSTGKIANFDLAVGEIKTKVLGKDITSWGYNGALVAPTLRASVGDTLKVNVKNQLKAGTAVHWHGLAMRNDQDGVQGVTQAVVDAGGTFTYEFTVPHSGTYWYHSHVDMQRERAVYGALIVADPKDTVKADHEWVIVLDDWVDGLAGTPEAILKMLSGGMAGMDHSAHGATTSAPASPTASATASESMAGMDHSTMDHSQMDHSTSSASPTANTGTPAMLMGTSSDYLGADPGDVSVPAHLFNGKTSDAPDVLAAKVGQTVRVRIINAAGDTAYRVGLPGQKLTITHTDGFACEPTETDAIVLGMGERIDATFTVTAGKTALLALPEGKTGLARGIIDDGTNAPDPQVKTLTGSVTDGSKLKATAAVTLPAKPTDRTIELRLTGSMAKYDWGINGIAYDMANPYANPFDIKEGERVEIKFINETTMWHPMHLHGHTFQVGAGGARKDTVIVLPKQTVSVFFDADNPGQWMVHCHNAYHAERGMMGLISYIK